jgi:hypothetical protein
LVKIFQPSFETRFLLTSFIGLELTLPRERERQMELQDLVKRFLVFLFRKPHQKSLKRLSNLLLRLEGSKKLLIAS